jgi:DNA-binding Xre family transcriptional regulator
MTGISEYEFHRVLLKHCVQTAIRRAVEMNKIKQIREQKGLSRNQVSKASGVWYKNLIDIENGKDVTLSTLRKIAAAMNCEVSDLV